LLHNHSKYYTNRIMFKTNISVTVSHGLGQAEALSRAQGFLEQVKTEHGSEIKNLRELWGGNVGSFSFTARGFEVSGTLTVEDRKVQMEGTGSVLLRPFKGKIEETLRERARQILA
jgi:hypothetical protein